MKLSKALDVSIILTIAAGLLSHFYPSHPIWTFAFGGMWANLIHVGVEA